MTVHEFKKPDLDEQMVTAIEQIGESRGVLRYFVEQRAAIRKVRDALPRTARPRLLEMLDDDLDSLDHDIETAEAMVADWEEILTILQSRAART